MGDGGIRLGWMGRDSGYLPQNLLAVDLPSKSQWVLARLHSSNKNADNQIWTNNLRQFRHPYNFGILKKTSVFWWDDFLVGSESQAFEPHVWAEIPWNSDQGAGCVCSWQFTAKLLLNLQVCFRKVLLWSGAHLVHKLSNHMFIEDEGPGDHLKETKDFVPSECGHRFHYPNFDFLVVLQTFV